MEANKPTATVLTLNLLRMNGADVSDIDTEAVLSLTVAIANSDIEVDKIGAALRVAVERIEPFDPRRHLRDEHRAAHGVGGGSSAFSTLARFHSLSWGAWSMS